MRKKILSIGIATLLLVSMLCVGGFGVSAATVTGGTMQELTTAEQTAALGDSLLAGKTAILPDGTAGTDLEKITDGQCDTIHGTSRATVKPAGFVNGTEALTMRLWFDLGTARQLNRLLVASSSFNPYQIWWAVSAPSSAPPFWDPASANTARTASLAPFSDTT